MRTRLGTAAYVVSVSLAVVGLTTVTMWNNALGLLGVAAFIAGVAILSVSTRPELIPRIAYVTVTLGFFDTFAVGGGINIRVYQVLSLLLIAATLVPRTLERKGTGPLTKWLVISTAACAVSLLWTISPVDTLAVTFGQAYLLYLFLIFVYLLNRRYITVDGVLTAMWVGAALSGAVAVVQFAVGLAGLEWHLQHVAGLPWGRPGGLMSEPDWAALVAAVGFLIALHKPRGSRFRGISIVLFIAVIGVTLVRAVIIALAVALFLMVLSKYGRSVRRVLAVGIPLSVIIAFFITAYTPTAFERLSLDVFSDSTRDGGALDSRSGVIELVFDRADVAPWTGHGAGTLAHETQLEENAIRYVGGGTLNAGRGSTNIIVTSFWDWGIPGVVIMGLLLLTWLVAAWKVRSTHTALFLITALLIVDFQVNNGFRFGFVWIVMALVSWAALNERRQRLDSRSPYRLSTSRASEARRV